MRPRSWYQYRISWRSKPFSITTRLIAAEGSPVHVSYLGRCDRDATAAVESGEAHVAIVTDGSTGFGARGAAAYVVRAETGAERAVVLLSAALCASRLGGRVRAALESALFASASAQACGESLALVRKG